MGLHVFPIPVPPPLSLSIRSLWVFPVHQGRALVSCIQPGLVICFTPDNIHVSMLEVFNYYLLKYFLMAFLFVFFWDSYDSNVGVFNTVPAVSEVVLIFFILFSFFPLFHLFLPFYLLLHLFYFTYSIFIILLLVLSRVFLISLTALFIID